MLDGCSSTERRSWHPAPAMRARSRALLSRAECSNGVLQSLHVGEPQGCGRVVEAPKLCRQRGDTRAVTVWGPGRPSEARSQYRCDEDAERDWTASNGDPKSNHRVSRSVDHRYGVGAEVRDI